MDKASALRTAQTVPEGYEEYVFRRFGASEAIRHDREPGFMSDFFRAFNRMVGQRQQETMAIYSNHNRINSQFYYLFKQFVPFHKSINNMSSTARLDNRIR